MASNPTNNFDFQNFYGSTLSSDISAVTLTIPLATVPTPSEGILIISPDSANPECIYYTSKGASSVTCASDGRGWDSTTGTAWTQGTTVIMAPTAYMLRMLKSGSLFDTTQTGWTTLGITPTYNATNGNHSYTLSTASDKTGVLSAGMRLKFDRSTAAPTQCTSLNGTTQYYSKTSPSAMTFTDDFVVSAWIKLTSYQAGTIASRYNGTSGWAFQVDSSGRLNLYGFNAASGNNSGVIAYQSVPLNKWVHVSAQLDMSAFTATTTTSYIMIDGVDVPATVTRAGTNPTALVQAGNLEIGTANALTFFPGKIAQVAIYNAKVAQATVKASMNQTLTGSETSLISAYSFNNTINDLSANANNLTANGSAVATNADSPFAQGSTTGLTEYGIITAVTASTITLQTPEGSAVPATGTMTSFYYSPHISPYNMPPLNKFPLSAYDTTNTTTLANSMVAAGILNPIDGILFSAHTGTGAGTYRIYQNNTTKEIRGITGAISLSAASSTTFTVNFPTNFFSTVLHTVGSPTGGADSASVFWGVSGNAATTAAGLNFYFTNTPGTNTTGSAPVSFLATGV